jgi:hypothetical protein
MRLAGPLFDREGLLIAGSGTALGESLLRVLRKLAVQSVPVADAAELASWETIHPLAEEVRELEARFAREAATRPMHLLRPRRLASDPTQDGTS